MTEQISEERRRLLQRASMGGLALLVAGCGRAANEGQNLADAESDDQYCLVPGKPGKPDKKTIDDLADELWALFDAGTRVATKSAGVRVNDVVRKDRDTYHRGRVQDNWSKINRCRRLTGQCAFNAGVVAALLAQAKGKQEIDETIFATAADAVFEMQRHRAGGQASFTGIAC